MSSEEQEITMVCPKCRTHYVTTDIVEYPCGFKWD